jgi:hypothetical protein
MKLHVVISMIVTAIAFPAVAAAGKVVLDDSMPRFSSTQVTVTARKAAAFRILMRTSTQGRTRLYLFGKHAPKGGALIDTKTSACDGAAGSFYCKGAYEPLPPGTYTFRVVFAGTTSQPAPLELTVRW